MHACQMKGALLQRTRLNQTNWKLLTRVSPLIWGSVTIILYYSSVKWQHQTMVRLPPRQIKRINSTFNSHVTELIPLSCETNRECPHQLNYCLSLFHTNHWKQFIIQRKHFKTIPIQHRSFVNKISKEIQRLAVLTQVFVVRHHIFNNTKWIKSLNVVRLRVKTSKLISRL